MTKADICREFRSKTKYKDMPSKKLARIIYNKHPEAFESDENVRKMLQYVEGKNGKASAKAVKNTGFIRTDPRPFNPYKLPKSDEETFSPYYLPKGHKRGLIINDVHLPYHSVEALTAVFDFAKKEKPDFIFINGDLLDFHQLSYFQKDPRKKRFSEELDMFKEFFQTLSRIFGCKIYFKFGNHEERYDSYLYQKAGELVGVEEFALDKIISARAEGITIIRDKRLVVMNNLPFIHGHEFGRGLFNPVNAARGLFLQAKHSAVKGDCHTTSEHTDPDIFGKIMTTWSVGCLCGLTPKWLPINKWNHGFAIIDLDQNRKGFEFRNYRIYKGKVL